MPSLSSLTRSLFSKTNQKKNDCYLIDLEETASLDNFDLTTPRLAFQYWPATVSDTKATNYQQREIPGGSLPLYQWISGGERLITFTAEFTTDVDLIGSQAPAAGNQLTSSDNQVVARLKAAGVDRRNADIRAAITWLRQYVYPSYPEGGAQGQQLTVAPRKLRLVMPGSGIGLMGMDTTNPDSVTVVMTQCDANIEQFFPSGLPRIATVSLSFAEVPQLNGTIKFPRRTAEITRTVEGRNNKTTGYKFQPKTINNE